MLRQYGRLAPILFSGSYASKVLGTQNANLIAYWPMWEAAGAVADNLEGTAARDGAYTGVTLGQPGIGDGRTCPFFDGANDRNNIYSTSFRDAIDGSAGSVAIWGKVNSAATWTDNAYHFLFSARDNPITDGFVLVKGSSIETNRLIWEYKAGNVVEQVLLATTPTTWFHMALTWDKAADEVKAYYNGAQTGATQTSLGNWGGPVDASYTNIGSHTGPPALVWHGWLAHCAVWTKVLTLSEILSLATV